ncbi:MAG TPA: YidB family protein [Candidatus Acidoferrales bacterium]|nr:YidB family protein [Candidatus Acidoferrales bacterium]
MGLLDNLESMAMSKISGSNPEASAVLEMIQNHPGGISGLVQAFHSNGLGGAVNSWIGTGPNQSITPEQIQQVLGSGPLQGVAQKLGVSPEQASSTLSQLLPEVMNHLTPNGSVPEHSNLLQMGESLLASLGRTGTES